jgi:signal transduction histidine kinase
VGKIRHILLGLAHNAVRFTEIGFVELRVWKAGSGQVGFQIRDSGEGIAAYMQKRLFSRFVRADGTEWRNYQGQQTGLAISKRLIELMGSTMQLETALGEGTKIRFILDLPESQPAARQQLT